MGSTRDHINPESGVEALTFLVLSYMWTETGRDTRRCVVRMRDNMPVISQASIVLRCSSAICLARQASVS